MRIEPPTERNAADDRAEIEITRGHGRGTEDMFGIEHSHDQRRERDQQHEWPHEDRKSTRLNSSHQIISYAVFCLKKKSHPPTPKPERALLTRHDSIRRSTRRTAQT